MADLAMRFGRDVLVLSGPIDTALAGGNDPATIDRPFLNLFEEDTVSDALRQQLAAGAQCLVTNTPDITRAKLAHFRAEEQQQAIAKAALETTRALGPQHVLAAIGPTGLPLDQDSAASLKENKQQYAQAASAFLAASQEIAAEVVLDAFFLDGFVNPTDLQCALMGVASVSAVPVVACAKLAATTSEEEFSQFIAVMLEFEAAVIGFETPLPLAEAEDLVTQARAMERQAAPAGADPKPMLVALQVQNDPMGAAALGLTPLQDLKEYTPDTLTLAGPALSLKGVQFLRATGDATPACTGALAASTFGLDVVL